MASGEAHRTRTNVLTVGDEVNCCVYPDSYTFLGRILRFQDSYIRVESIPRSDDSEIDNEFWLSWNNVDVKEKLYAG